MQPKSLSSLHEQLQALISESPLQRVSHPLLSARNISLSIKRDDLLHTHISGNKWRKLKFNLIEARSRGVNHILSFGGAYSNHIHALAAAGFHFGFKTSAIIRGESHYANNPTLQQAQKWGMQLHFVTRKEYQLRNEADYLMQLQKRFSDAFILPEGGSNAFAIPGIAEACTEINQQSDNSVDHIITATGSGGTLAGLVAGCSATKNKIKVTGIAVLKQGEYLNQQIQELLKQTEHCYDTQWQLQTQFHGGGYAKVSPVLKTFCRTFEQQYDIPIEPIYTGKMFYALFELLKEGYFNEGDHIVALHTGGLQGRQGFQQNKLI
ncbi:1-aminocyclopropane-1-carboxylate deaminase [Psychromonas sp. psych-6C06]|uniref:1-aminocyclopropane-1-carboxylate deaminase/D-cysteine desulfhydrase n=1 Tax=Psychromonas sp. psych-6C06 TaxID=2058089 RepID=UPI000C320C1C|nr:pyridoxal-phosphate dependent enzyme [Psychromonas sp. psych-6C06]PKF62966.1 1-aminocyclopropane-1-carboxylate deaminase [Psychromonas sp. psych-6C06]